VCTGGGIVGLEIMSEKSSSGGIWWEQMIAGNFLGVFALVLHLCVCGMV
jgi:hypothetical protein